MSPERPQTPAIPARVTVTELASLIGVAVESVQHALEAREEPAAEDEILAGDMAKTIAADLGVAVSIEPRDTALEILYRIELGGGEPDLTGSTARVETLVRGVLENMEALDHEIESASEHWSVARMPVIDRNILRLGLFELRHLPDTPTGVIVSEGVRLARTYSTERSGSFVNGVLASLSRVPRGGD